MVREARLRPGDSRIPRGQPTPGESTARSGGVFTSAGLLFLAGALCLYLLSGYMVYRINEMGPVIEIPGYGSDSSMNSERVSDREVFNFFGRILSFALAPLVSLFAAVICTVVGTRLLRSSGVVATQVISSQDYPILGPAIVDGNEKAITQYIRLSSLSGMTGTFTKIGLTGLPLATIFLTIFLGLAGLSNEQFFDLAKLTLGAFLGSFVQRQSDAPSRQRSGDG